MDYTTILLELAIVLGSLTVHEAAHAWTADRLGDPTARMLGRLSLNPVVHIDPIGTILLPLVAAFSGLPILGWAKPVPVNVSRLREPRAFMLVAAAGPASNILLAVVAAIVIRLMVGGQAPLTAGGEALSAPVVLLQIVFINVLLAVFNLVPVPPLDGGNVLAGLLPRGAAGLFAAMRPYGFFLLYALMFTGVLTAIVMPPSYFLIRLLLP
ncbi:MAG: site-2 protease family protein, partial [Actinobacteria bacterium]|nr:site-2 protease family protein [Actinomycetota bacterium]